MPYWRWLAMETPTGQQAQVMPIYGERMSPKSKTRLFKEAKARRNERQPPGPIGKKDMRKERRAARERDVYASKHYVFSTPGPNVPLGPTGTGICKSESF